MAWPTLHRVRFVDSSSKENELGAQKKYNFFVSWSGTRSCAVAAAFSECLPKVCPRVVPFYSTRKIQKGRPADAIIGSALSACDYGLICVTRDNVNAPWLLYEAGAISKNRNAVAIPYLVDVTKREVPLPLSRLQMVDANEGDTFRMVRELTSHISPRQSEITTRVRFDKEWPEIFGVLQRVRNPVRSNTLSGPESEVFRLLRQWADLLHSKRHYLEQSVGTHMGIVGGSAVDDPAFVGLRAQLSEYQAQLTKARREIAGLDVIVRQLRAHVADFKPSVLCS